MITVTYRPKHYSLKVTGHAMADEIGRDLVCAACSALVHTLGENVESLKRQEAVRSVTLDIRSGQAEISCVPNANYRNVVRLVFDTIANGLKLLGEKSPEYLKMEVFH